MTLRFANFDDMANLMHNENSLKILFYLMEFNPNVSVDGLVKNLAINKDETNKQLERLMALGIVENKNSLFRLSVDGRKLVNSFYHNLGEVPPHELHSKQV